MPVAADLFFPLISPDHGLSTVFSPWKHRKNRAEMRKIPKIFVQKNDLTHGLEKATKNDKNLITGSNQKLPDL